MSLPVRILPSGTDLSVRVSVYDGVTRNLFLHPHLHPFLEDGQRPRRTAPKRDLPSARAILGCYRRWLETD